MNNLIDFIRAEERIKLQSVECEKCECFNCLEMELNDKCRNRCFKNCKNKKHIWIKCSYYNPIS